MDNTATTGGARSSSWTWQRTAAHLELGRSLQARHLEVELARAFIVDVEASCGEVLAELEKSNFDFAPVMSSQRVIGFVQREVLADVPPAATIRGWTTELADGLMVSADAPISDLMDWISESRILFVVDGHGVTGFITIWDFNKQAARAFLYLVLAGLETALADLIRWRFAGGQERLLTMLSKGSRDSIRKRQAEDREDNADGDLVAYLDLKHLLRVVEKDGVLRDELGGHSMTAWRKLVGPLPTLRNTVMHPVRSFIASREDLIRTREYESRARAVLDAAVTALRHQHEQAGPADTPLEPGP